MPRLGRVVTTGARAVAVGGKGGPVCDFDTEQWTRIATHVEIDRDFLRRWTHTHQRTCTPSFKGRLHCTAKILDTSGTGTQDTTPPGDK